MRKISLVLLAGIPLLAVGQTPDFGGSAQKQAIAKLNFMIGEWQGSGWALYNSQKFLFEGTEVILPKCEGTILSLEGNHSTVRNGQKVPIHNAFGMLRYDEKTSKYFMRAHLANGLENEYEFKVLPNGYSWKQESPTWGNVEYTAEFKGDDWLEYGEIEKDGKRVRVYEMRMKRVKKT